MAIISLIAIVDEAGGLGYKNKLLCHLPADLKHFKTITMGKPIIMGRKTYQSIGKPLPGRLNIVVSRTCAKIEGAMVVSTIDEALSYCKAASEIMIIGGASLYAQTLPLADRLYLTMVHNVFAADVYFPTVNKKDWICRSKRDLSKDEQNLYDTTFYFYERIAGKPMV